MAHVSIQAGRGRRRALHEEERARRRRPGSASSPWRDRARCGSEHGRDVHVVPQQVALGEPEVGPERLAQVGEGDGAAGPRALRPCPRREGSSAACVPRARADGRAQGGGLARGPSGRCSGSSTALMCGRAETRRARAPRSPRRRPGRSRARRRRRTARSRSPPRLMSPRPTKAAGNAQALAERAEQRLHVLAGGHAARAGPPRASASSDPASRRASRSERRLGSAARRGRCRPRRSAAAARGPPARPAAAQPVARRDHEDAGHAGAAARRRRARRRACRGSTGRSGTRTPRPAAAPGPARRRRARSKRARASKSRRARSPPQCAGESRKSAAHGRVPAAHRPHERLGVERVEHLAAPHPPPPGHGHAIAEVARARRRSAHRSRPRSAMPRARAARIQRGSQVEPVRVAVDLDRRARRRPRRRGPPRRGTRWAAATARSRPRACPQILKHGCCMARTSRRVI